MNSIKSKLSSRIHAELNALEGRYYRLVLVVGPAGSGKTSALLQLAAKHGWPRLNVNLRLAECLLELTPKQRSVQAAERLAAIINDTAAEVVLLDSLELLFAVDLMLNPLRMLQSLSRHRTIIAAWPGQFTGETLSYAEPGHPEARREFRPDARIIITV